jgi:hypothetical protein
MPGCAARQVSVSQPELQPVASAGLVSGVAGLAEHPDTLDADDQLTLKQVRARCPHLDDVADHVSGFAEMMVGRHGERLDAWIDGVEANDQPDLRGPVRSSIARTGPDGCCGCGGPVGGGPSRSSFAGAAGMATRGARRRRGQGLL